MELQRLIDFVPTYFLVALRVAAMMLFVPLFGSSRIPKRIKVMFALVIAAAMCVSLPPVGPLPDSLGVLTIAVAGELAVGLLMGMVLMATFIAVQWAGEIIGQQIGFNLAEVLDPAFGRGGSVTGEMYFLLALVVFMTVGGPRQLIMGVHESFYRVPPLQITIGPGMLDAVVGSLTAAMGLAIRVAAPLVVSMLISDVAIGCLGRTMPQFNIMSSGLNLRAMLGLVILFFTLKVVPGILDAGVRRGLFNFQQLWPAAP